MGTGGHPIPNTCDEFFGTGTMVVVLKHVGVTALLKKI